MGKYNSSIYRVRPLMEQVEGNQQNFLGLLALVGIGPLGVPQMYRYEGKPCGEMQLKPSQKRKRSWILFTATQPGRRSRRRSRRLSLRGNTK